MSHAAAVLTLEQVGEFASTPHTREQFSALSEQHYLLVDLSAQSKTLSTSAQQTIRDWLQQLPCPTIAITNVEPHPLSEAFDVTVESLENAKTLLNNIERTPIAAMTLVQVLRCTAMLPAAEGLVVESLAYATLQSRPRVSSVESCQSPNCHCDRRCRSTATHTA